MACVAGLVYRNLLNISQNILGETALDMGRFAERPLGEEELCLRLISFDSKSTS